MLKTQLAVLVSGGGTNLQALAGAQETGKLKSGSIRLVVSSRADAYALKRAEKYGIPAVAVDKRACASQAEFEEKIQAALVEHGIQLVVLAGFIHILSEDFVSGWRKRIINVHPSLIPAFCGEGCYGLRVHEAALRYGVKLTGATVHFVNEIPDGGEIILQKCVPVRKDDTPETLQKRVMERAERLILPRAAELISKRIIQEGESYGI
ncbi:MAG: phosphoribosylglycinamide formyltransferase [Oscillospiraceae bacterium]|jgi:phosphoribosylglycinamide formyltransferase-1|nr:phosphoribosylglycinamide formyltransferase [Oscillospiraceae bacterium]